MRGCDNAGKPAEESAGTRADSAVLDEGFNVPVVVRGAKNGNTFRKPGSEQDGVPFFVVFYLSDAAPFQKSFYPGAGKHPCACCGRVAGYQPENNHYQAQRFHSFGLLLRVFAKNAFAVQDKMHIVSAAENKQHKKKADKKKTKHHAGCPQPIYTLCYNTRGGEKKDQQPERDADGKTQLFEDQAVAEYRNAYAPFKCFVTIFHNGLLAVYLSSGHLQRKQTSARISFKLAQALQKETVSRVLSYFS